MRNLFSTALGFIAISLCLAGIAQAETTSSRISGRIFFGGSGAGIPDIPVYLYRAKELRFNEEPQDDGRLAETATDADGHYHFADIPAGNYLVGRGHNDSFPPLAEPARTFVALDAAESVTHADFPIREGSTVSGKVTDQQGQPIANAQVLVTLIEPTQRWMSTADTEGKFSIQNLPRNALVRLHAVGRGYTSALIPPKLLLLNGSNLGGLHTQLSPGTTREGTMVDESGEPLADLPFEFIQETTHWPGRTDAAGRFEVLGLGSENSIGQILVQGYEQISPPFSDGIRAIGNGDTVVLRKWGERDSPHSAYEWQHLLNWNAVGGQVVDEDGKPIPNAHVYKAITSDVIIGPTGGQADGNGRFLMRPYDWVESGTLSVGAKGYLWQYFNGIKLGTRDNKLVLRREYSVHFVVLNAADRKPIPRGRFMVDFGLMMDMGHTWNPNPFIRQMMPAFQYADDAGHINVTAEHDKPHGATVAVPGYVITRAEATPGGPPVEISLEPEVVLRGRVVDGEGKPVPRMRVTVAEGSATHGPSNDRAIAHTEHDGSFEVHGIGPGEYTVAVRSLKVEVLAHHTREQPADVTLQANAAQ